MPSRMLRSLLVSFALLVSASLSLHGQSTYGSISGSVTDSSGATVTDAKVTLTNLGTAEKRAQSSGSDGLFTFVNLFAGQYRIDVEKQGFKHFVRTAVTVDVQQDTHIDAALQVGEVSQVVEVTSETPLLQAETSSLGTVVDQREANELPLNGRNIFNLTTITPSVIPQGSTEGNVVGKNPFDFANYQIGGAFANEGAIYLDGQPLNIGYINLPFLVPTDDSIGEFKVQDNNLGPEWGKFAGGVINMSTKSGTNKWHGEGYEYLRNKVLNANEFFNKGSEIALDTPNKPVPFTQNQFGGDVGGAIIKNKTFVFGSYEGFRLRQGTPFNTTVPTLQERQGDFSDLCTTFNGAGVCQDGGGSPVIHQLYNPLTATALTGPGSARTPFPFNCIADLTTYCQTNAPNAGAIAGINPTSSYLLGKLIANPTSGGTVLNFLKDASTGGDTDEYVVRVDQVINSRQTLFGRFSKWKLLSLAQDPFGTGLCKDRCAENTTSKSVALGYNFAISPNTIFNLNASISRFIYLRDPLNSGFDMTQEDWPSAYNALVPNEERTPLTPCFGQNDSLVGCSQGQSAIGDFNTQFNISPSVTMIRGHHTYNWGLQLEEGYDNYLQTNTGGGLISFAGSWTSATPLTVGDGNGSGTGEDFADFLLGYGNGAGAAFGNQTSGSLVISGPISGKQTYRAFYFGDTWHATPKLTLNLGVRYELQGPWSERYDKMTYFNPSAVNASVTGCSGVAGSPCLGDLFLVKTGVNSSRNNLPLSKKEVLPRLGFAYALDSKTVIRGGYGIFFIPNYVSFNANPYVDPVSSATSSFFNTNDHGISPAATLNTNTCAEPVLGGGTLTCVGAGPFNQGTYVAGVPTVGANNLTAVPGRNPQPNVSQYGINQTPLSATGYTVQKYGYLEQYNLDFQRQLPGGFFADVAYAGSHGVHLEQSNTNVNQIPDSFIAQASSQYATGGAAAVTIAQPAATYPFACPLCATANQLPAFLPGSLLNGQLDRPYPEYTGVNLNGFGCCGSNYNALQATVTRRFQGGGTLLVAYTNAKLMSNTDTLTSWLEGGTTGGTGAVQDWNNLNGERSLSSQDVPQRLVTSYVLDLPFGHGKKFLSSMSGVGNAVVSGWGLDGIMSLQRGFPVKISWGGNDALTSSGFGVGTLRPDYVSGCDKGGSGSSLNKERTTWFNTTCFTAPSGNNGNIATPNNPWTFGDEPRVDATLRQQGVVNFDFAVFKRTTIMERLNVEFRAEFFDLFNHPQFGPPNGSATSPTFGVVTNTVNNTFRIVQFGLKFSF
jgi:carboxypeptidase family protein